MKAVHVKQFGGPEVLNLADLPDPIPGDGEVLIRLHATGVNPVETYVRAGKYAVLPPLPYTPGHEAAGVITALGASVVDLKVGQRVWVSMTISGHGQGTYAEQCVAAAGHVHALPDALSFEQGAAINVAYVTAHRALFDRADLKPGDIVLIHGATGGVGLAAVQIAARHGAIVLGTGGTAEGRKLAEEHGAAKTFDHKQDGYIEQIKAATNGRGVDVVIEMAAHVNLDKDLAVIGRGGRVVVIGSRGPVQIDPRQLMVKEPLVTGVTYWGDGEATVMHALAAVDA
ncbi:MAG: Zn-dependent oxidoreductase, NADPH:quinone reductase, partial [Phycisphaerales bacterium]|nr:Zn-dependent oxidoreductase, NADPH:quinone reductase [Phycisphaerales bacterium]